MVRRYDYDSYATENRERFLKSWIRSEQGRARRLVRTRPRAETETKLLDRLARDSWEKALESGELVRLTGRRFRLRVF